MSSVTAGLQTGNLYGTVTDAEGERLPGVTLTLTGAEAPRIQVSDANGQFRFLDLSPGRYSVKATLEGFSTVVDNDVEIRIGTNTTIEIKMSRAIEEN